jgi:hypothetical protein
LRKWVRHAENLKATEEEMIDVRRLGEVSMIGMMKEMNWDRLRISMDVMRTAKEFHIASWGMIRDHRGISKTTKEAVEASKTARWATEAYWTARREEIKLRGHIKDSWARMENSIHQRLLMKMGSVDLMVYQ